MARSILAAGMLAALALLTAKRNEKFISGSPPPCLAAIEIKLAILVNDAPRLASAAAFLCLILCHFE